VTVSAVVLAGGQGTRFGSHVPKPFMSLNGRPVIDWSLDAIEPEVDEVVVVAPTPYRNYRVGIAGRVPVRIG
jgi:molybdopterin-guanine dinucleotide biosynthesis protein A